MKKSIAIIATAILVLSSCQEQDIRPFDTSDSALLFKSKDVVVSLRNYEGEQPEIGIPVRMIGPVSDRARYVQTEVVPSESNTAVEGKDFVIDSLVVPASALEGTLYLKVNRLQGAEQLTTTINIIPDDNFPNRVKDQSSARITWTAGYTRPEEDVWISWFLLFSSYYSVAYHEVVTKCLGDDVDMLTHRKSGTERGYNFKVVTWWYGANRVLYDYVESYDKAHPDAPLMHSSDVRKYSSYEESVGGGVKPETIPTILSTLNQL